MQKRTNKSQIKFLGRIKKLVTSAPFLLLVFLVVVSLSVAFANHTPSVKIPVALAMCDPDNQGTGEFRAPYPYISPTTVTDATTNSINFYTRSTGHCVGSNYPAASEVDVTIINTPVSNSCINSGGGTHDCNGVLTGIAAIPNGTYQVEFALNSDEGGPIMYATLTINRPVPTFYFACDQTHSTTTGSSSDFSVWATPSAGFSSNITVTATVQESPGPVASPATTTLTAPGYIGTMHFTTTGLSPGTYHITFNASGGSFTAAPCPATLVLMTPDPVISSFTYNDQSSPPTINIPYGTTRQEIDLGVTNATNGCDVSTSPATSNGTNISWTGHRAGSVTEQVTPNPLASGLYTFTVTCSNSAGSSVTKTLDVNIGNAPPQRPTADLKCKNGVSWSDGPCDVVSGSGALLSWTSQNADYCDIEGFDNGSMRVGVRSPGAGMSTGNLIIPPNTRIFTITCTGAGGSSEPDDAIYNVQAPPAPTVSLLCQGNPDSQSPHTSPCTVDYGTAGTIQYTVANATSCQLNGVNVIVPPNTGTLSTGNLIRPPNTQSFTMNCSGPGGTASGSVVYLVRALAVPTVDLQCIGSNGTLTQGPCSVTNGTTGTLSWTSRNATTCSLSGGGWSANNLGPEDTVNTPILSSSRVFTATCTGPGGTSLSDSVTFNIQVTADLRCKEGGTFTNGPCNVDSGTSGVMNWSSTGATSCSFTALTIADDGNGNISGTTNTAILTAPKTYTLSCSGPEGTASDSVDFNINNYSNPDFSFTCSPLLLASLPRGNTAYVTLQVQNPINGFVSAVALTSSLSGPIKNRPTVSISPATINSPYTAPSTATISTTGTTSLGTYTLTFTATGGGVTHTCVRTLQITDPNAAVQPPSQVQVISGPVCGQLTVTWRRPVSGPVPTKYRVYRTVNVDGAGNPVFSGAAVVEINDTGDIAYSYVDRTPLGAGTNYYGVTAVTGGVESTPLQAYASGVPQACNANLSASDKDVIAINGVTNPGVSDCGGSTNSDTISKDFHLIKSGDVVTFKINICNSGFTDAVIQEVTDTFINLIKPASGWKAKYTDSKGDQDLIPVVVNATQIKFDFSGSNKVIPKITRPGTINEGSIQFDAQVGKPTGGNGLFRFQNTASIMERGGALTGVHTPLFLFSTGAGAPNLEEIAP